MMTEEQIQKELSKFISMWESEEQVARMFSGHEFDEDKWYLLGRADAIKEILDLFKAWKNQQVR